MNSIILTTLKSNRNSLGVYIKKLKENNLLLRGLEINTKNIHYKIFIPLYCHLKYKNISKYHPVSENLQHLVTNQ